MRKFIPYSKRPLILNVKPRRIEKKIKNDVIGFTTGAFVFIIEILLFYPNREYYFIARDVEYFYDIARILLKEYPLLLKHFHLINVNRDTLYSPNLHDYLQQEGLNSTKRIVLIDSGFNGNVIERIQNIFYNTDILGIMIYSENPCYNSSYAAMTCLGICFNSTSSERKRMIEKEIEHIPHYSNKALLYELYKGKIEPFSIVNSYWQKEALKIMSTIHFFTDQKEVKDNWFEKFKLFKQLVEILKTKYQHYVCVRFDIDCLNLKKDQHRDFEFNFTNSINKRQLKSLPIGFLDFLREVKQRTEDGHFLFQLISKSNNNERISKFLNSYIIAGKNLKYYGAESCFSNNENYDKNNLVIINYPDLSCLNGQGNNQSSIIEHQKEFIKLWDKVDSLDKQEEVPENKLRKIIKKIIQLPEGPGFIRDLLEYYTKKQLGVRVRDELIGMLWNILIHTVK